MGCRCSSPRRNSSAGEQWEQPSEVNNSTTTGTRIVRGIGPWMACGATCGIDGAAETAANTKLTDSGIGNRRITQNIRYTKWKWWGLILKIRFVTPAAIAAFTLM